MTNWHPNKSGAPADGAGVSFVVDNDLYLEKIQQLSVKIKLLAFKPQIGWLFLCLACLCE